MSKPLEDVILEAILSFTPPGLEGHDYISEEESMKEYCRMMSSLSGLHAFTLRINEPTYFQKMRGKIAEKARQSANSTLYILETTGHAALLPGKGAYLGAEFIDRKMQDVAVATLEYIVDGINAINSGAQMTAATFGKGMVGIYHILSKSYQSSVNFTAAFGAGVGEGILYIPTIPFRVLAYPFKERKWERARKYIKEKYSVQEDKDPFHWIRNGAKHAVIGATLMVAAYFGSHFGFIYADDITSKLKTGSESISAFFSGNDEQSVSFNSATSLPPSTPPAQETTKNLFTYAVSAENAPQDIKALEPSPTGDLDYIIVNESSNFLIFGYFGDKESQTVDVGESVIHTFVKEIPSLEILSRTLNKYALNELKKSGRLDDLISLLISGNQQKGVSLNYGIPPKDGMPTGTIREQVTELVENADGVEIFSPYISPISPFVYKKNDYDVTIIHDDPTVYGASLPQILALVGEK